jgi:predicted aminopeptidase
MQGKGQFEVLWNAKPIDVVLNNPNTSEALKRRILLVDTIKRFTHADLEMDASSLYTSLYDQKDKTILWNLSASEPFAMKSVEWIYPIVGKASYKGYFDLKKAKIEQQRLDDLGFDTRVRPVNAWSTLGWFNDPILSNMLNRSVGNLAELFIHEITHSHIFIEDSITFNENLASFIGEQGARLFLSKQYGVHSKELLSYIELEYDYDVFTQHCLIGLSELEDVYANFDDSMDTLIKNEQKTAYLERWVERLDSLPFNNKDRYSKGFADKLPNNAFFMAFERYTSIKEDFSIQLAQDFDGDLKSFIHYYKEGDQ